MFQGRPAVVLCAWQELVISDVLFVLRASTWTHKDVYVYTHTVYTGWNHSCVGCESVGTGAYFCFISLPALPGKVVFVEGLI